jgi:hypothetical protein
MCIMPLTFTRIESHVLCQAGPSCSASSGAESCDSEPRAENAVTASEDRLRPVAQSVQSVQPNPEVAAARGSDGTCAVVAAPAVDEEAQEEVGSLSAGPADGATSTQSVAQVAVASAKRKVKASRTAASVVDSAQRGVAAAAEDRPAQPSERDRAADRSALPVECKLCSSLRASTAWPTQPAGGVGDGGGVLPIAPALLMAAIVADCEEQADAVQPVRDAFEQLMKKQSSLMKEDLLLKCVPLLPFFRTSEPATCGL